MSEFIQRHIGPTPEEQSKMLDDFVRSISSKKGTTEAGVNYIKSQNIEKIIYTTLQRAYQRSKAIDSEKKNTKSQ